jgi:hypothetical protein
MTEDAEIDIVKYSHPGGMTVADRDQAKPLLKVLKRMLQPRHPKTRKFSKPRRTKVKQSQYY